MSKDAKGHGSNSRGGSYQNIERSAFHKGMHVGYGGGTFKIQKFGSGETKYRAAEQNTGESFTGRSLGHISQQLSDRAAAAALAQGHPKSAPVPVHANAFAGANYRPREPIFLGGGIK